MIIKQKLDKHKAICQCEQCSNLYVTNNLYATQKTKIGHLCQDCKNLMKDLVLTKEYLNKVLDYDPDTGILKHKLDSSSGVKGDVIGTQHSGGYLECRLGNKRFLVHRLIWAYMTGEVPEQIDHIDHNRMNNKWNNLRKVNNTENSMNTKIGKNNSTGVLGVALHKPTGKYRAYINKNRRQIHLGLFDTIDEARNAREFANLVHGYHKNHGA